MPGVVTFNLGAFLIRYPIFNAYNAANPGALQSAFDEGTLYLDNSSCSIVCNLTERAILLNMLTAHIAFIGGALSADGQTRPVGRVSDGAEGSVSASFDMNPATPGTGPWYQQSQYGASYWAATSKYRSMHYRALPTNPGGPGYPNSGYGMGFFNGYGRGNN